VCKRGSVRLRRLNRSTPANPEQALALFADLRRITTATTNELAGLETPPADQALIEKWISVQRAGVPLLERLEAAARTQDSAEFTALSTQIQQQASKALKVIGDFPFRECGRRSSLRAPP
jgi:hypothetical protein